MKGTELGINYLEADLLANQNLDKTRGIYAGDALEPEIQNSLSNLVGNPLKINSIKSSNLISSAAKKSEQPFSKHPNAKNEELPVGRVWGRGRWQGEGGGDTSKKKTDKAHEGKNFEVFFLLFIFTV